jgi:hypothetical protein
MIDKNSVKAFVVVLFVSVDPVLARNEGGETPRRAKVGQLLFRATFRARFLSSSLTSCVASVQDVLYPMPHR